MEINKRNHFGRSRSISLRIYVGLQISNVSRRSSQSGWVIDPRQHPGCWVRAELAGRPAGALRSTASAWAQRLRKHVRAGQYRRTMDVYRQMQQERILPDARTFLPILNACAGLGALEEGRKVHFQIRRVACESDIYVATCLVDMYAKCGSIDDAWSVFIRMQQHNRVTWNAMIRGYVKSGQGLKAMELFRSMQQEGMEPDAVTFIGVLNACASVAAHEEGRRVHKQIRQVGCESIARVATCLVDMYAKCGSLEDAWSVFDNMAEHDVVAWSAMIMGYVKSGQCLKAMELFRKMQQEGVEPNAVTFVGVLSACAGLVALEEGRHVHEQIIRRGLESNNSMSQCLVDMYAKCGSIDDAWSVFYKMRKRNVVTWNTIIGGYVKSGQGLKAIELFREMQEEVMEPDAITFVAVLNACARVPNLQEGRRVHRQIVQVGCELDVYIANCLVDMYGKCGSLEDARSVFNKMQERNVVTWTAMIGGYVKSGQGLKAMELFRKMQQEGVEPNAVTFVAVLNACASVMALEEGKRVHSQVIQVGYESDVHVATSLVDMYAKCGRMADAWSVFNNMSEHNVVTWSTMILGHVKSGQGLAAIDLFNKMQQEGVEPDTIIFIGVLIACSNEVALEEGRRVHGQIIRRGCECKAYVANCLVDMYAKCGSIEEAWKVFNKMDDRDLVSWNAMIAGYAMHGQAEKAVGLFEQMKKEGVKINAITFTCLLSACSHGGLVKEGLCYFESMSSAFNILPTTDHYACMVDLLGRAGHLGEAEELIKRMSLETHAAWMSLLGACRVHGDIEMAERAAKRCWELDPGNSPGYVILSNTYAAAKKYNRDAVDEKIGSRHSVERDCGKESGAIIPC